MKTRLRFLRALVALIGIAALVFLLGEPHLEGRNAHATLFEIYFKDALLAFVYVASVPFFVAVHRTLKVLGHVGEGRARAPETVAAVRTVKRCALCLLCSVPVGEIFIFQSRSDDRAGGVFMGLLFATGAIAMAATAAVFERRFSTPPAP